MIVQRSTRDNDYTESYKSCLARFEELTGGYDYTLWVYRVTRIDTGEVLYESLAQTDVRMSYTVYNYDHYYDTGGGLAETPLMNEHWRPATMGVMSYGTVSGFDDPQWYAVKTNATGWSRSFP